MVSETGRKWIVVSVLLLFGLTGIAAKASTITADNLNAMYSLSSFDYGIGFAGLSGFFSNETPAQEFTALVSGTVTTLTATVQQVQPEGVPLNVSIFTAGSGLPKTRLGTVSFPQEQVSSNVHRNLSGFDLSTGNISLTAGQSYFAVFSVATPINGNDRYEAILLNLNTHSFGLPAIVSPDGGRTWLSSVISNEIGMTVLVHQTIVPEPSSVGFVVMTLGTLFLFRRYTRYKTSGSGQGNRP